MFIFTVCQIGAEAALKKEIAGNHPDLRFAYSRPGFLTFKSAAALPLEADFTLKSIFARAYGVSLAKATRPEEIFEHARALRASTPEAGAEAKAGAKTEKPGKLRLHLWERDAFVIGEEPKGFISGAIAQAARTQLRSRPEFTELFHEEEPAETGDLILDLIYIEEGSWWIGYHRYSAHSPRSARYPGGKPAIALPEDAPSRAYLKLEEALIWSGAPFQKGDCALEIGSAPGGASYALLERGLKVVGIDPAEMAPAILKFAQQLGSKFEARFKHLAKPAALVGSHDLPKRIEWILLDMNVAPVISLNTVERIAPWYADSLLGVVLTLKLNDWKFTDEIPKLLRRVEKLGMVRIRARQLAYNKQEICVVALNRLGTQRVAKMPSARNNR